MESETFFDAERAVKLGFADKVEEYSFNPQDSEIEYKAVAMLRELNQSFNDYPQAASDNARKAIQFKENNPTLTCGTQVGWIRAAQLAGRENLSVDTIGRMAQFERFQQYKDDPYLGEDGQVNCGRVMWDAWGGDEGIEWAKRKLEEISNSNNLEVDNMKTEKTGIEKAFKNLSDALGFTAKEEIKNEAVEELAMEEEKEEKAMEEEKKESYNMTDEELAKIAEMVTEMLKPQFESLQDETLAQAKNSAEEIQNLAKQIRSNFKPEADVQFKAKGQDQKEVSGEDAMWARMKQRAEKHRGVKTPMN
jgi:hypothetical protein